MSVTTRTNLATNPSLRDNTTNYASVAGTSGVAALNWVLGPGYLSDGYGRVLWSTGTTATTGGVQYTQTGISANTQYAFTVWVWSSRTQGMRLVVTCRNASNATVNTINGLATSVPSGEWVPIRVTGTTGAAVTNVVIQAVVFSTAGAVNWQAGDTLDVGATLIEAGSTYGDHFDGSSPDGGGVIYNWTGAANSSTSTAVTYVPVLTATPQTGLPCPRVVLTVSDLDPNENVITIWRISDGRRRTVRGAKNWTVVATDTVTDYEPPLNVITSYELEITSGISAGVEVSQAAATATDTKGWLQDPLDPESAVPVYPDVGPGGEPSFTSEALKRFDYEARTTLTDILGSDEPIAQIGQRMRARNVPFHFFTDQAQQSTNLRDLLSRSGVLLLRPLPEWANALPGGCYISAPTVSELPVNEGWGGQVIEWQFNGALVKAPTINIVVVVTSYGDVQAVWATYQQAQTSFSGDTYLYAKQNPSG